MSSKTRIIEFPENRLMAYIHLKEEKDGSLEFHGRFLQNGELLEGNENPGWRPLGEARSSVEVPETSVIDLCRYLGV